MCVCTCVCLSGGEDLYLNVLTEQLWVKWRFSVCLFILVYCSIHIKSCYIVHISLKPAILPWARPTGRSYRCVPLLPAPLHISICINLLLANVCESECARAAAPAEDRQQGFPSFAELRRLLLLPGRVLQGSLHTRFQVICLSPSPISLWDC